MQMVFLTLASWSARMQKIILIFNKINIVMYFGLKIFFVAKIFLTSIFSGSQFFSAQKF